MAEISWDLARPEDNSQLLKLLAEVPVQSPDLNYALLREPDFFASLKYQGHASRVLVLRQAEQILGLMSLSFDEIYLDGQPRTVAYTGELKLLPQVRGQGLADLLMQQAVLMAREVCGPDVPILTCVAADNLAGLKKNQNLAQAGLVNMQQLTAITACFFPALPLPLRISAGITLRPASLADFADMAALWQLVAPARQLSRVYRDWEKTPHFPGLQPEDWLLLCYREQIVGFVGLWNQQALRQILLPRLPLSVRILGQPARQPLKLVHAVHLCLHPEFQTYLPELIKSALHQIRNQGQILLTLAMDSEDPLLELLPLALGRSSQLHLLGSHLPVRPYPFQMEIALG